MRLKQCGEVGNTEQFDLDTPAARSILSVAKEYFLEKEYGKVIFRQTVEQAGVTSGLIVYYFESKSRLVARITAEHLEEGIQKMGLSAMNGLDNVGHFHTVVFLDWLTTDENSDSAGFYYSCNRNIPGLYWENGNTYTRLVCELLGEYRLDTSERQNEIYLIACRGSTRELLLHRHEHSHLIIRETAVDITTSNYFYNLKMSDKAIYRMIQDSKAFSRKHYPHVSREES